MWSTDPGWMPIGTVKKKYHTAAYSISEIPINNVVASWSHRLHIQATVAVTLDSTCLQCVVDSTSPSVLNKVFCHCQ